MTAEPRRTCIGCRQVRSKAALLRLSRGQDGRVRVDWDGTGGGRGAYVCAAAECLTKALGRGKLGHAFRGPSEPPEPSVTSILERKKRGSSEEDIRLWRER